jgi:hypothetical protein
MWSVNKRTARIGLLVMNSGTVKSLAQKQEILYDMIWYDMICISIQKIKHLL